MKPFSSGMNTRLTVPLICCLLIAALGLSSCSRREKVIPRSKMARIYAEMFVADQQILAQGQKVRTSADTSWVYEPIFRKYGYTSDDYRTSVAYYLRDANRFARILRQSASIIEGDIRTLKKQKALEEMLEMAEAGEFDFTPERIYFMTGVDNPGTFGTDSLRFYLDSAGGKLFFDARDWADTAYFGPLMVLSADSLQETEPSDTLEESPEALTMAAHEAVLDIAPAADNAPAVKQDGIKPGPGRMKKEK